MSPLEMLGMAISILANVLEGGCFAAIFYNRWGYFIWLKDYDTNTLITPLFAPIFRYKYNRRSAVTLLQGKPGKKEQEEK